MRTKKAKPQANFTRRTLSLFKACHYLLVALLLCLAAMGEADPIAPLPQDTGTAGLKQALRRLQTTARLMQVVAHPDDEDGGLLTLESRGKGVSVTLMTLTRGEGGQNKVGGNLFDGLGVLRTLELTASDRYYGVEQRFSRVADFGFSKSADETFQKWQGHDVALADIVRVIRTFQPDVLIARFSGTERDGHGHHQASGILTKEAFRAAADPTRFPEQIKEGLRPWQAKKLYNGNVCGFFASTCPDENYTIKLNTGTVDPVLGMSYIQFAMEGLRHQLSQGAGSWKVEPGDRFTYYKLNDSTVAAAAKNAHETSFFDGMDTTLAGLAAVAQDKKLAWLRPALDQIQEKITSANAAAEKEANTAVGPLLSVVQQLDAVVAKLEKNGAGDAPLEDVVSRLKEKQHQAETALCLALNLTVDATALLPQSEPGMANETSSSVSPGQKFAVTVKFHNGSNYPVQIRSVSLEGLPARAATDRTTVPAGKDHSVLFPVQLPPDFGTTRPYWHRDDPGRDTLYQVDDARYATLPFPPFRFFGKVAYSVQTKTDVAADGWTATATAPVLMHTVDAKVQRKLPLSVAPAFSVMLDAAEQIVPVEDGKARTVKVTVASGIAGPPKGDLHLELPAGWRSEPERATVELHSRGEKQDFAFKLIPGGLKQGRSDVRAVLDAGGQQYSEGYSLVTREDLSAFYYYQPASQRVSVVDVEVPHGLKVGYIMGAGDDVPTVLKQVGIDLIEIAADKLADTDLTQFATIVLGIRVYDTQKDVVSNNKKLLDFVSSGGTLLVQYNASTSEFNGGHFTPFPAQLGRGRVSVEDASVELLVPQNGVFRVPNEITSRDFDDWIQERGLYFMDQWDGAFTPLLSCHDPGEPPQKGGLLRARYGKGTYIYTGYAFFRQLPAGVPGAVRLFVNLLNAGHEGALANSR